MNGRNLEMNPELLTAMLAGTLRFAKLMLGKAGEFYPFGETADPAGTRSMRGGYNGEEHPDPREIYLLLQDAFARNVAEGNVAAVALAANVDIPEQYEAPYRDAIRVHVEAQGYSRYIYLPYRIETRSLVRRLFRRPYAVSYAEVFSVDAPPVMFPAGGPADASI